MFKGLLTCGTLCHRLLKPDHWTHRLHLDSHYEDVRPLRQLYKLARRRKTCNQLPRLPRINTHRNLQRVGFSLIRKLLTYSALTDTASMSWRIFRSHRYLLKRSKTNSRTLMLASWISSTGGRIMNARSMRVQNLWHQQAARGDASSQRNLVLSRRMGLSTVQLLLRQRRQCLRLWRRMQRLYRVSSLWRAALRTSRMTRCHLLRGLGMFRSSCCRGEGISVAFGSRLLMLRKTRSSPPSKLLMNGQVLCLAQKRPSNLLRVGCGPRSQFKLGRTRLKIGYRRRLVGLLARSSNDWRAVAWYKMLRLKHPTQDIS